MLWTYDMMSFQKIYSPTQLANAMKLVRQQNGWTQSELAKKIGIKQATISNFENNPDNTTLTTFFKILQSLELSMTLCDTKNASPESTETARSGVVMPKLVTWMNNQRVGELTKLANGAHTFKYAPEWLANRYARPLSLSLPLQRGNITSDAVFNFFDNLLPDSPIVRDRIVKRYHAKSRQPFDLLSEIGRDSVGAVTLIPEDETIQAGGSYRLTPFYDIISAFPVLGGAGIHISDLKLAMGVNASKGKKTAIDKIYPRHFLATAKVLKFPEVQMHEILSDFARMIPAALDNVKTSLPTDFPEKRGDGS